MKFTEFHHAFISASYYKKLAGRLGQRGLQAFDLATIWYAQQRGFRMAQRAVRDGKELDFKSYCSYGEWSYSEEFLSTLSSEQSRTLSLSPDYSYEVYHCPWHMQYEKMGLTEGAIRYCRHLDLAIARGFNPYLDFQVHKIMHTDGTCVFCLKNADLEGKEVLKDPKNQLSFDYHCAHIYFVFQRVLQSIFAQQGQEIAKEVLDDFGAEFGPEAAEELLQYKDVDFDILPVKAAES